MMGSSWPELASTSALPLELKKGVELNGRYVIAELCGAGAFAQVWRATDKQENRDVAIKRLSTRFAASPSQFLAEAESVKKLKGHKNIVQLYETFVENGEVFLVMEYVGGGSLDDLLKKHIRSGTWIEQEEAVDYIRQILEGLIYAHSSGLYHRDIKPSNILISQVGVIKLADFGLAKAMAEEIGASNLAGAAWTGTPQYMSYEQARGESMNHQTDIMSVGIVAYMLISGRHPFNHPSGVLSVRELIADQAYAVPRAVSWDNKPLKSAISDVLYRMLQKDKASRYQSLVEPLGILSKDDSVQCSKCTASNPKTNRFCGQCGASLAVEPDGEIGRSAMADPSPQELNALGFQLTKNNDWDGAIRSYREALKKNPKFTPAHANLGFALNRMAEYQQAIEVATDGLASAQDDGIRHRLFDVRGFARNSLNDPFGAIEDYTSAIKLRDNPRVFVNRATAFAAIGDIKEAIEDASSALDIDSDYYPALRLMERLQHLL